MNQTPPFNTFRLEKHAGEYKDFHVAPDDPYPLKGVTYPVNYGDIPGYTGEDGHDLDIFAGDKGELFGWFTVSRPGVPSGAEHKFYLNLTEEEQAAVLKAFEPVLVDHQALDSFEELLKAIEPFKNES